MKVVTYTAEQTEQSGMIAQVYPFGYNPHWAIVVYPGQVGIEGAAVFSPTTARDFAEAVKVAAQLAEDYHACPKIPGN